VALLWSRARDLPTAVAGDGESRALDAPVNSDHAAYRADLGSREGGR